MKRKITAGTTSLILPLFIADTSSTVGAGLTGLAFNSAGLAAKYKRMGQSTWTTITLATMTAGTYTSGGFVESDSGAGGSYEFCPPDAAIAAGATAVVIEVYGATNMLAIRIEIELDAATYQTTWSTFDAASQTVDVGAVEGTDATDYFDALVTTIRSGLGTSAKQDTLTDETRFLMAVLMGAISNAQNAAEEYVITRSGSTFTVTFSGLDEDGNRTSAALVKS